MGEALKQAVKDALAQGHSADEVKQAVEDAVSEHEADDDNEGTEPAPA